MAALETSFDSAEVDARERPWWMDHAVCKGQTEVFFAPHAERPSARERREYLAKEICEECGPGCPAATMPGGIASWDSGVARARSSVRWPGIPPTTPVIGMPRRRAAR